MKNSILALTALSTALGFGMISPAQSTVISLASNIDITEPYTVSLGDSNQASYTFGFNGNDYGYQPISITTGGTAKVASIGFPFYPTQQPTTFYINGRIGPASRYTAFPSPTEVGDNFYLGLQFTLDDGTHYGYALVNGYDIDAPRDANNNYILAPTLVSFAYESDPDVLILAGAAPAAVAVPEPSGLAIFGLGLGLAGLGLARRRRLGNVKL